MSNNNPFKLHDDDASIKNILTSLNYTIDDNKINRINFVDMYDYAVSNKEKDLLMTFNLQTCIALYAVTSSFSFLAHMNMYGANSKYDFDIQNKRCYKIEELYNRIVEHKNEITSPIVIGIILGVSPLKEDYETRIILQNKLDELFNKLDSIGISYIKMTEISSYSIIIDTINKLITYDDGDIKKHTSICLKHLDNN